MSLWEKQLCPTLASTTPGSGQGSVTLQPVLGVDPQLSQKLNSENSSCGSSVFYAGLCICSRDICGVEFEAPAASGSITAVKSLSFPICD